MCELFFVSFVFVFVSLSGAGAVDFDDLFGYVDELVHQTLAVHLRQDAALVVISVSFSKHSSSLVGDLSAIKTRLNSVKLGKTRQNSVKLGKTR